MKSVYKITLLFGIIILVSSCHNTTAPNYQYFPDMYESVGYETYSESKAFKNGKEAQLPAEGSINRGFEPFEYENSTAGYDLAKTNLKSPLDIADRNPEKGKELYEIYCMTCHGAAGDGNGKLVEREKFLGVPEEIRKHTPTIDTYSAEQTQEEFFYKMPFEVMDRIWDG